MDLEERARGSGAAGAVGAFSSSCRHSLKPSLLCCPSVMHCLAYLLSQLCTGHRAVRTNSTSTCIPYSPPSSRWTAITTPSASHRYVRQSAFLAQTQIPTAEPLHVLVDHEPRRRVLLGGVDDLDHPGCGVSPRPRPTLPHSPLPHSRIASLPQWRTHEAYPQVSEAYRPAHSTLPPEAPSRWFKEAHQRDTNARRRFAATPRRAAPLTSVPSRG